SAVEENGNNGEENKVIEETRKIFGRDDLPMSVTCVRVPVLRAHTEVVRVTFTSPVTPDDARRALEAAEGVQVMDDPAANRFPMPVEATGVDDVLVGRVRQDPSEPRALDLMICGDQLLKGAALNAVQVAERLTQRTN
ncbi:MAG: Asd/ArgC dimerization domain-containing protein, partial [Myxococcota bacterium]|nr:Asd/ArgC dimerization domain-containing protein [Myxococcota bacterium]